jgi:hypothetical protein
MKQMYVGGKSNPQKSGRIQKEKDRQDKDILHIGVYSGKKCQFDIQLTTFS